MPRRRIVREAGPSTGAKAARAGNGSGTANRILQLQRTIGNRAVYRMVIQRKMTASLAQALERYFGSRAEAAAHLKDVGREQAWVEIARFLRVAGSGAELTVDEIAAYYGVEVAQRTTVLRWRSRRRAPRAGGRGRWIEE